MASACQSLRECERWRGEILREISRKVSKIQDAGLSDYEIRDLNDEINKLLREKRHWENQIVALGGANYRRNVAMLDDDGKEVPGTKGYKYFGRAKDLPGVKELFQSRKNEEDEENATVKFYKRFMDQGEEYYGDGNGGNGPEDGGEELLRVEREEEENDWEEMCAHVRNVLGLPEDTPVPAFPLKSSTKSISKAISDKLKPPDADAMEVDSDPQKAAARMLADYIPFFEAEELMPPKLLSRTEMEGVLLELRKKALVGEYFGDE